ncbi:MAG: hypothetical protein C0631_15480 [Sedimenticola sp.]|nr:MAG: hypothetical protein C0631_15480 [Sedimenticola sp.]
MAPRPDDDLVVMVWIVSDLTNNRRYLLTLRLEALYQIRTIIFIEKIVTSVMVGPNPTTFGINLELNLQFIFSRRCVRWQGFQPMAKRPRCCALFFLISIL